MSNEELATRARNGDAGALQALWEQNRALLFLMFSKLYKRCAGRAVQAGWTLADAESDGFIAVATSVQGYDTKKGKFTSWLAFYARSIFFSRIGYKGKPDAFFDALRIDEPVGDADGETTRGDLIEDPAAENDFSAAEDRLLALELHAALDECMKEIPEEQAEALRACYYRDEPQDPQTIKRGISGMRKHSRKLMPFYKEIIGSAYTGTGFSAWYYGGASVPERIAERLEKNKLL